MGETKKYLRFKCIAAFPTMTKRARCLEWTRTTLSTGCVSTKYAFCMLPAVIITRCKEKQFQRGKLFTQGSLASEWARMQAHAWLLAHLYSWVHLETVIRISDPKVPNSGEGLFHPEHDTGKILTGKSCLVERAEGMLGYGLLWAFGLPHTVMVFSLHLQVFLAITMWDHQLHSVEHLQKIEAYNSKSLDKDKQLLWGWGLNLVWEAHCCHVGWDWNQQFDFMS